jgi:hypothetical protein
VNAFNIAHGVASFIALGWLAYRLTRARRDVRLWAVTLLVACWAIAYPFGLAAGREAVFLGVEPMTSRFIQHALVLVAAYALMCFFLFSALELDGARRRAAWQAVPLAAAVVILAVATLLIPADLRTAAAMLPSGQGKGPVSVPSIGVFYVTANGYMLYAFVTAFSWNRRYARGAEPRLRRGLAMVSVGLAAIIVADALFITANIIRWAGGTTPRPILAFSILLLLGGIVVFLIGVLYPAAAMRVAALRIWRQHLRTYHQLNPLWTTLHEEFPQDALSRVPISPWRDALSLRGVHRRYYRRVIECRDGLVRISPYLAQVPGDDSVSGLAGRLRAALRAHTSGEPAPSRAVPVAMPAGDGLDADVERLVALSQALQKA